MELSKEVHGLLDRIKRLSNAQKSVNDTYPFEKMNSTFSNIEEIEFNPDDIIPLDDFDVSDRETWLYVSESPNTTQLTNVNEWLNQDFNKSLEVPDESLELESDKYEFKKNVDTRTFTRPKKRISRPTLDVISDSYQDHYPKMDIESLKIPENPFLNLSLRNDVSISTGPLHFKLSDPVMNHSFDKILLTASDGYDSFQNMSPPSLVNSLCSSQFNTLLDSTTTVTNNVPNDTYSSENSGQFFLKSDCSDKSIQEIMSPLQITIDQKDSCDSFKLDSTLVSTPPDRLKKLFAPEQSNNLNFSSTPNRSISGSVKNVPPAMNITFEKDMPDAKSSVNLNSTFQKNIENKSLNSTFTNNEKALNSTFTTNEKTLNSTFTNEPKSMNSTFIANKSGSEKNLSAAFQKGNDKNTSLSVLKPSLSITLNKNKERSLNNTFSKNSSDQSFNSTFTAISKPSVNSGLNRSIPLSFKTSTFTKKPRNITNLPEMLKKSCPDINRTFQSPIEKSLNRSCQKLSDSQPNLTKDIQQTILNQSMELMNTDVYEGYHNARSGSTDSLDDKSSSISSSSKDSGSKVLNMGDLDNLARLQEKSLHQIMSTPKPKTGPTRFWDAEAMSPIHRQEDYLSEDSDISDQCMTARSGYSKQSSSSAASSRSSSLVKLSAPKPVPKSNINKLLAPTTNTRTQEVSQTATRNIPTVIVKPMEVDRTFKMPEKPQAIPIPVQVRPRIRASGLPRPTTALSTGIPRPTTRIPGPRLTRPQIARPSQRPPPKADWMDGCY